MSEPSELRSPCPGCGKSLRFPPGTQPGKHFKCPRCGVRVAVPGPADKREAPAFLETCPACAKGRVLADPKGEEGVFACTHCESRISETMLGYLYLKVDSAYVQNAEAVKSRLFTRPQLRNLSEAAARSGEPSLSAGDAPARPVPKPKPPPPPPAEPTGGRADPASSPQVEEEGAPGPATPPPPETAAEAPSPDPAEATSGTNLSAADLMDELEGTGADAKTSAAEDEDLWWEVDEEALAARGGPGKTTKDPEKGEEGNEDFNVDDLLDELR